MLIWFFCLYNYFSFFPLILFFFLQEANTEKIFYGLDDIVGKSDVIIVCIPSTVQIIQKLKFCFFS